jgi:CheY-like chemotaxis protein
MFPVLVLAVFSWLVAYHSKDLFGPSDYKHEENYVKMQLSAVAALTAASSKDGAHPNANLEVHKIVEVVQNAAPTEKIEDSWRNHILWVDDRPDNNSYERQAFEAVGIRFTLALSTNEAFEKRSRERVAAIISDMGRSEGPREGYVLLDELRRRGDRTPLFFYAASNSAAHKRETVEHGGQGCTNNSQELFQMVTKELIGSRTAQ